MSVEGELQMQDGCFSLARRHLEGGPSAPHGQTLEPAAPAGVSALGSAEGQGPVPAASLFPDSLSAPSLKPRRPGQTRLIRSQLRSVPWALGHVEIRENGLSGLGCVLFEPASSPYQGKRAPTFKRHRCTPEKPSRARELK